MINSLIKALAAIPHQRRGDGQPRGCRAKAWSNDPGGQQDECEAQEPEATVHTRTLRLHVSGGSFRVSRVAAPSKARHGGIGASRAFSSRALFSWTEEEEW